MTTADNVMAVYEVTYTATEGKVKVSTNATTAAGAEAFVRKEFSLPPSVAVSARHKPITASQLAARHEAWNPETRMFSRENMKFAGDTMGNFYVPVNTVKVRKHTGEVIECWELQRRRATVKGFSSSFYFCAKTYAKVNGELYHGQDEPGSEPETLPAPAEVPAPRAVKKTPRVAHMDSLREAIRQEQEKSGGYVSVRCARLLNKLGVMRKREYAQ